jgi:drug/metabolite transporter (DMT)-like permease
MNTRNAIYPMAQALLAALLFGASAPLSKLLLGEVAPIPLAAFLYLGCGTSLLAFKCLRRKSNSGEPSEAPLLHSDLPWLAGAILTGGVAAPIILLFSLQQTPAATASLLLNFEGVATTLIATLIFKEAIGRRIWAALLGITVASILLSWNGSEWGLSLAALGVVGACGLWGLDNNFTRHISAKDPLPIAIAKGLGAGTFSLLLALGLGQPLPRLGLALSAMLVGSLSYGISLVLFVRAMRGLGAARTSAMFGTAPLAGMGLSFLLFRDMPTALFFVALALMAAATVLLLNEQHGHAHTHDPSEHEHCHEHNDLHHTHDHPETIPGAHSHWHQHDPAEHQHPHTPDIHHRHGHPATN